MGSKPTAELGNELICLLTYRPHGFERHRYKDACYRPISNLPFISKLLERAVNERLLLHLHSNGLLPEHQSAYRRSHSTETALLKVTSDALIVADMGKLTLLGMLDLRAAFDCVDHDILLCRLGVSFGFGGTVLDWMRSYLVGRRQYIRYNGLTSSTTVVQFGVP